MKHAATRALFDYWDRLRAGRAAPERSEVDPGSIRALLGDVFMIELGGTDPYAVRLAGTRICSLLGQEWKGRSFTDPFAPRDWPEIYRLLDGVAEAAQPMVGGILGETEDGRTIELELLVLPLRHRGKTHARLMGSLVAADWPYWAGNIPVTRFRLVSIRHLEPASMPRNEQEYAVAQVRSGMGRLRVVPGGRA
jgi:hypothetical protein